MTRTRLELLAFLIGLGGAVTAAGAQTGITGVILRGGTDRAHGGPGNAPTVLAPGVRVESPRGAWTEIAFSDGTSIVLEPGADFTLQGIERDSTSGRLVIRAVSGRGRIKVSTSDTVEVLLITPTAQVRIVRATALIVAGPQGSVTLIAGSEIDVRHGGRDDTLRRPGFAVAFADGGAERSSRQALAQAIDMFAPVPAGGASETSGGEGEAPPATDDDSRTR